MWKHCQRLFVITGLPGAGKTTLSQEISKKSVIINLDSLPDKKNLELESLTTPNKPFDLVIEGLISDNYFHLIIEQFLKVLRAESNFKNRGRVACKIVKFDDDIEACLFNDKARGTIQNLSSYSKIKKS